MQLACFVQTDDSFRDLCGEIATVMGRLQIEAVGDLTKKVERRTRGPVQINHLEETRIQTGQPGSGGGGLAGADFAGEKTRATVFDEELQASLDLLPAGVFEQLLGIGFITERDFLEAEEGFKHRRPPSSSVATPH